MCVSRRRTHRSKARICADKPAMSWYLPLRCILIRFSLFQVPLCSISLSLPFSVQLLGRGQGRGRQEIGSSATGEKPSQDATRSDQIGIRLSLMFDLTVFSSR